MTTTEQGALERRMVTRKCPHCDLRNVTHRAGAVESTEVLCPPCLRDLAKPDPTDCACDCRRPDCGECAPMLRLHAFDGRRTLPRGMA